MQHLPRVLVDKFAQAFAGDRVGFSAQQISEYFCRYSNLVKPFDHYGINPTRRELFVESLYSLPPKIQYYALNELVFAERPSKYAYPDAAARDSLRRELHNFISRTPIGLSFSRIRETAFREDWVICQSRIEISPAAAITAARTMLETLLKTIISERGGEPDATGDIGKLIKQAGDLLGINRGTQRAEHQILSGLGAIINGLATISNAAGDRHGNVGGKSIDDPYFADLCVNAAGTIGLAFIEMHLFTPVAAAS
jgi:hypothetical protein